MKIFKRLFGKKDNEIKCFEEIENIFHLKDKSYGLVFFPLCSINLKKIIPSRDEWIHFVDVWNNGDIEDFYFHKYRTIDLIKFKLEDSKYYFYGDEKAFPQYENLKYWEEESRYEFENNLEDYIRVIDHSEYEKSNRKLLEDDRRQKEFDYDLYVDERITYLVNKERYKRAGEIINHKSYSKGYEIKSKNPMKQIGGKPQWTQRDMTPKDKNGIPLTFIGEVTGFHFKNNGSDAIFLFLDEKTNEVVEIIQFG